MKVLDLFSGIGGFSLGLERVGMDIIAHVEKNKDCQKVLKHHWPSVRCFTNIEDVSSESVFRMGSDTHFRLKENIDVICGGYPCTGHSVAGKKEGLNDEQSGLWAEYYRLIREIKPRYCIIENSHNLRATGLERVLQDITEAGYNAEWSIISGYSIGAPHQRERIFIVLWRKDIPYPNPFRWWQTDSKKKKASSWWWAERLFKRSPLFKQASKIESRVCEFDDGVSKEVVDQNKIKIQQLGNAVIPQIIELIGKALMEHEESLK